MILPDKAVGREQRLRADDPRVAGRDVEGIDVLMLGLAGDLIIGVRHIERRPRRLQR